MRIGGVFLSEVCLEEKCIHLSILPPYYENIINVFVFVKRYSIETKTKSISFRSIDHR